MIDKQKPVWAQVVDRVGELPNGATRSDIADFFHVHKTTAQYHLERGVKSGLLVKVETWADRYHRGWVYYKQGDLNQHNVSFDDIMGGRS